MAFVPGYKYDIFISYATVDNDLAPGVDPKKHKGWVTTFRQGLEKRLAQLLGRKELCSIWMDERDLSRYTPISDNIAQSLEKTALFIIILSPGYLASEWCENERSIFFACDCFTGAEEFQNISRRI